MLPAALSVVIMQVLPQVVPSTDRGHHRRRVKQVPLGSVAAAEEGSRMLAERMVIERKLLYGRTISQAAQASGGHRMLASRLGVSPGELMRWMRGSEMPPVSVFLECMDILQGKRAARQS